ncbi:MAG: efflux RND transporter periplasmic adaptor subunit [Deltaproteobacteria bacterium]|nr:efflux RND transporter periplasmic adaptor subunit [Deltaproteobacteria bacterium]
MITEYQKPETMRGKIVFFFWYNLPRFVFLAMMALILILFFSISEKYSDIKADQETAIKQERPPINTVVMEVVPTTISNRINLPGSVESWTKLELISKIAGSIDEVLVKEGDAIKKDDVIARIESDDYRIALERARAAYKLAKADYERDKSVYAKGVIPTAELDARETNMQTAKADLDNAELMFARCTITAPMDGVVRRLDAKIGLYLSVGDPIGSLLQIDKVKAVIGIPESDVTAVRLLDSVEVTIQALEDKKVTGRRYFISSSPETAARLYRLELEIDNPGHRILPGMFVRANIVKQQKDNAVAIPFYSVISRSDQQFVFVEKDGTVEKRYVQTGIMEQWMVEITKGLKAGERIVVEGHRDVEDGRKVKVVKVITDPGAYSL